MSRILIVDDDPAFRETMSETLADLGHLAVEAANGKRALEILGQGDVELVLLDFKMPGIDGVDVLKAIRGDPRTKDLPVVVISAFSDSESTIRAMKYGAIDHLTKPIQRKTIEKITAYARRPAAFSRPVSAAVNAEKLVGESESMREVHKFIGRAAGTDSTVLIVGETGTGKEVVARAIHVNSDRAAANFIALNCAAIPRDLLESELFGHVRGAFTGAGQNRMGAFERANGGTLLLDEIGDMPLELQAKILRVIQEQELTPVGGEKPVVLDVRLLAATHQNLEAQVSNGEFRRDLYYRLNVLEVRMPPLRERRSDIAAIAAKFLRDFSKGGSSKSLSPDALKKLEDHDWPGNVRELKNVLERAVVLGRGELISPEDLPWNFEKTKTESSLADETNLSLVSAVENLERRYIEEALRRADGNRSEAARLLGIQRQLLYTKLKRFGLDE